MSINETENGLPDVEPSETARDYRQHEMTYAGFKHLLRWIIVHLGLMVIGLYFLMLQGNGTVGTLFILLAVGAMVYGVATIGSTADTIAEHPERWHGAVRDMLSRH